MDVPTRSWRSRIAHPRVIGPHGRGFTLVELMLVLTIVAILFSIAAPDLNAMMQSNRMSSELNHLLSQLHYARSEAVMRNSRVRLCKSIDGSRCTTSSSVRWDRGWLIFVDTNDDGSPDGEVILKVQPALEKIAIAYGAFGSSNYVTFYPSGRTNNATFTYCDPLGDVAPRAIILFKSGRMRTSATRSDGSALVCPE